MLWETLRIGHRLLRQGCTNTLTQGANLGCNTSDKNQEDIDELGYLCSESSLSVSVSLSEG